MKIRLGLFEICARDVADYCGGCLTDNTQDGACQIRYVCTDSREADAKTLFVATRGERVDGHDYILSAIEQGCRCVLCERIPDNVSRAEAAFITVRDSIEAFSLCAKGYREGKRLDTVAITGSVGKTTTKELTASILKIERSLYATEGNFNSIIGMPMSLMAVEEYRDTAVFEMGMSAPGEIRAMTRAATPDIAMVINIGSSHLEYLKTRDNIALAKLEIAEGLKSGGMLLLNGDEPLLYKHAVAGDYNILYVGTGEDCDIIAEKITVGEGGTSFDLVWGERRVESLNINLIGKQLAVNAAFAAAAAMIMGISEDAIRRGLADYIPGAMRQNITQRDGVTVISDCYNAAPESMRAAIDTLTAIKTEGKRIAVLGDMRELGDDSEKMHREVGAYLAARGVDALFTLGGMGRYIAQGALDAGLAEERIHAVEDTESIDALCESIRDEMREGDTLLFKASRGVALERAIKTLFETT